jgi:hypothetical protein
MQLSALLAKLPGVEEASAVMATENNVALLSEAGLAVDTTGATASDLLIVVRARVRIAGCNRRGGEESDAAGKCRPAARGRGAKAA